MRPHSTSKYMRPVPRGSVEQRSVRAEDGARPSAIRAIATTLLAAAVFAAPSAYASDAPVAIAPLPPVGGQTLPEVPLEPPKLPVEPPPLVPEVKVPDLPLVTPVPASVPTATPASAGVPATAGPPAPAGAGPALPARGEATGTGAGTPGQASASNVGRATPRRGGSRPDRGPARRRDGGSAAPARGSPDAIKRRAPARTSARPVLTDRTPERPSRPPAAPSLASRVPGELGELVRALPAGVLWALVGLAAIAFGLAANAFWQSRQRTALEAQRAELLDDIGLLSRALLPPVPGRIDGLAVSAAYRPADGPAAGGDFYDVFTIGEQRICVLLGDVSGHGRESVTHAALARYTLRTLLAAGHPPGEALARADELLVRDLRPNFVTVIAGVYEPGRRELTYAKAGHAPPIVLGAAHDPDAERPVPPIGLGVGDTWPEYRVQLREGVSVCLFTDGLEDARVGDARVGRAEVARLLAAHVLPDAGRLLGDIEDLADRISDDTAAIVLSRPLIA